MELTTRNKLLLLIGAPITLLLGYWLLRGADDDDEEEETSQKMATSRQTVIDVKVPPKAVGAVIGRQGAMIKEIQQKSGARVNFTDNKRDSQEERGVVIRGTPEAAQMAENMIRKIIAELPVIVTEEMVVPGKCLGRIIGRNGDTIRQMSRTSKAKVYVDRAGDDYRDSERTVTITGTKENIELAKSMIQEKIDDEELFRAKKAVMEANREQRQKPKPHVQDKQLEGRTDISSSNHDQANGGPEHIESLQVHPAVRGWPEGRDYVEVYVSAVANPGLFWVQIVSTMSVELDNLVDRITSFYTSEMSQVCTGLFWVQPLSSMSVELYNLVDRITSFYTSEMSQVCTGLFWVQPLSSMSVELDNLVDRITSFYTSEMSQVCTGPFWVQPLSSMSVELDNLVDRITSFYTSEMSQVCTGLFWVQPLSSMSVELDNLVDRITSFYTSEMSQGYNVSNPATGDLVAAPFENDTSWYRAKVMGVEGDTLDLLYVDYGDSGYLPCNKVQRMRSEFETLPFQAIECHLAHVKPVGKAIFIFIYWYLAIPSYRVPSSSYQTSR
ncbi:TDRKH [Mytilus coruscus]|uniref:TDRKH n=1 Tax=Mytilus coruscus TaxID=42192 RepID=A0A6J8A0H3_MYTCO|nr:TDRKH [Mytilus coruscus]